MLSFHNDPVVKQKYADQFTERHRLGQIIQDTEYNGSQGYMVGCMLEIYTHELGLPVWYAYLCDAIFEGLPKEKASKFTMDSITSIPVGVDIEPVKWQLAILRHKRNLIQLELNKEPYAQQCREAINQVIRYCESELAGTSAESAAESAESAESAAWATTWATRAAATWAAPEVAAFEWEAETLIRLLRELKPEVQQSAKE